MDADARRVGGGRIRWQFDGDGIFDRRSDCDREKRACPVPAVCDRWPTVFGSVLAYRITCELVDRGIPPHRLVVLSFPAPDNLSYERQLHTLSDEMLVEEVDQLFGGIPENIREDKRALQFFVPGLRFDLGLLEGVPAWCS